MKTQLLAGSTLGRLRGGEAAADAEKQVCQWSIKYQPCRRRRTLAAWNSAGRAETIYVMTGEPLQVSAHKRIA